MNFSKTWKINFKKIQVLSYLHIFPHNDFFQVDGQFTQNFLKSRNFII